MFVHTSRNAWSGFLCLFIFLLLLFSAMFFLGWFTMEKQLEPSLVLSSFSGQEHL